MAGLERGVSIFRLRTLEGWCKFGGKVLRFALCLGTLFRFVVPGTSWLFLAREIGKGFNDSGAGQKVQVFRASS